MRYSLIIIIAALLLAGCTGQKFYTNKGVSYFEQPAKELDFSFKSVIEPQQEGESVLFVPGRALNLSDKFIYPVRTSFLKDGSRMEQTSIYSVNALDGSVADSLIMSGETGMSVEYVVQLNDLYAIGIKNSKLYIVKMDNALNLLAEFPLDISLAYIAYAGRYNDMLRLVAADAENKIYLYDLNPEGMTIVRKRLLTDGYYRHYAGKSEVWFFAEKDDYLEAVKTDLSVFDPVPVYKTFMYPFADAYGEKTYSAKAVNDIVYISYLSKMDKEGTVSKLVAFNFKDGTMQSRNVDGMLSYDIATHNGKTYIYRTAVVGKTDAFILTELKPDLSEGEPLVKYFLSGQQMVKGLQSYSDGKFVMTGTYYLPPAVKGKAVKGAMPDARQLKPFLTVFDLD
jgi:hypothetical protein